MANDNGYAGYIVTGSKYDSEGVQEGFQKQTQELQKQADSHPIVLKLDLNDNNTKERMTEILSKDLESVGKDFNLIKTEFREINSGQFKGLIKSIETFSDDVGETKQRVTVFKESASGDLEVVDTKIQKVISHNLNYQQAMELTAKKLSTLSKEVEKSPIYDENGMLKGWKTTTTALMSSGQELKTIVTEEEEAGILTKKIHQEIRKWNKDFTDLEEKYHQFGKDSVETINLRQQAEEKYLNTLLKEKKVLEESYTFQTVEKKDVYDKEGNLVREKGTKVEQTWKTITDQYGTKYQTITKKWQDELGNTIEVTTQRIKEQGKAWSKAEEISKKIHNNEIENAKKQQAEQERLNKTIKNKETLTNSYNKTIKGVSHQIQKESTVTEDYAGNLKKVSKETDTFTDSQGRLVTKITSVNAEGQRTTETLIKMGNSAKHLGQSFSDVIVKVAKFYVASLPIRAVQNAITNAVQSVKDFDSAITEFKKVSDLSGKSLDEYCDKLERLGNLTARTRKHSVRERIVICV